MKFEDLYQLYYEQIFRFCYRFVLDMSQAGDITQDTFVKMLHRMRKSNQTIQNPKAWLYKVASNLCLNSIHTHQRRSEILSGVPMNTAEHNTPESLYLKSEKEKLAKNAIDQLKPDQKLLLLMYQDGLSYKEMSEATGIPLNSVGKTLWRNIEKVSLTLKKTGHE